MHRLGAVADLERFYFVLGGCFVFMATSFSGKTLKLRNNTDV